MKLVVLEAESSVLEAELRKHDEWLSAIVCVTEVMRATKRWIVVAGITGGAANARFDRAAEVLRSVALIDVDGPSAWRAGAVDPAELRTLDAIHLATAIDLSADLEAFVTYDARLATAAGAAGLNVLSPR